MRGEDCRNSSVGLINKNTCRDNCMSKKVCHLSSHHSPNSVRIFRKQCVTLAKSGYDVTYVVPGKGDPAKDGVKLEYIKQDKGLTSRLITKPYRVYKKAKAVEADIYHFHDPELLPYGYLLKKQGKKVIYDIHEDLSAKIIDKKNNHLKVFLPLIAYFISLIEKNIAKTLSYNIVVNNEIKSKFKTNNIEIITNLPIISLFQNRYIEAAKNEIPIVVYAGLLNRIRGIKEIVEAIGIVGGKAKLVLLGRWQDQSYKAECIKSAGWIYTEYKGMLPLEAAYKIVQESDIGIVNFMPMKNHLYSMPNKAFEYMAAAKPMIMSNFPYWQDLFEDCALFNDPEDPNDIAANILELINVPSLMAQKAKKAREMIENKYSWEAESLKLLSIYRLL
jgi:glycosyltransferase involved in cell wall biosynthesis